MLYESLRGRGNRALLGALRRRGMKRRARHSAHWRRRQSGLRHRKLEVANASRISDYSILIYSGPFPPFPPKVPIFICRLSGPGSSPP